MESITLTEKHKEKLLEMCKVLFPQYHNISIRTNFRGKIIKITKSLYFDCERIGFPYIDMGNIDPFISYRWLHWYELCMTHLARKIFNSGKVFDDPVSDSTEGLVEMIKRQEWYNPESYHPVHYLYEQFKKMK